MLMIPQVVQTIRSMSPHPQILTCALCDARSILNKSCEILVKFLEQGATLNVRVLNDVEFASMNRIKLIAC